MKTLINKLLFIVTVIILSSCKKYERNTLYFIPPESILCFKSEIEFLFEKFTINENEINLGYDLKIYLRNSPTRYMALYENTNRVYELDDDEFGCIKDYFPISPIKINGSYRWSKKWKIIYLDKNKIELKYIDEHGNVHVMSFKIKII